MAHHVTERVFCIQVLYVGSPSSLDTPVMGELLAARARKAASVEVPSIFEPTLWS